MANSQIPKDHFNFEKQLQKHWNTFGNTQLARKGSPNAIAPTPANSLIILMYGWDDEERNYKSELEQFLEILGVSKAWTNYCVINTSELNFKEELKKQLQRSDFPIKILIYFGHGVGSGGAFAFDVLGGRVPVVDDETTLLLRFLFLYEVIDASVNSEKVYLFIGACASVGADIVPMYWNRTTSGFPRFYVRQVGVEIGENRIVDKTIEHSPATIELDIQLVLGTFAKYIASHEEPPIFPWEDDKINVSYETDRFLFRAKADAELLVQQAKVDKLFLKFLGSVQDDVEKMEGQVADFGYKWKLTHYQKQLFKEMQKYEVHAHFTKRKNDKVQELTAIHIKRSANGAQLDYKLSIPLVEKLMSFMDPTDRPLYGITNYK